MRILHSLILVIVVFSTATRSLAQCNDWENLLSYENTYVSGSARDRFGNLYALGTYTNHELIIGSTVLPLPDVRSIFFLKFDKTMTLQWAKSIGTYCNATAIEIDKDNNPVISGLFFSASLVLDGFQLSNSGRSEMFLAKYCTEGSAIWASGSSGLNDGAIGKLAITASNDIVAVGSFVSGRVSFAGRSMEGIGGYDSFVTLVAPDGSAKWLRSFGGTGSDLPDYIFDVAVDSKENILVTGFFESPRLAFDGFSINAFTISENYFVAKLSNAGSTMWAKGAQAPVNNSGWGIAVGKNDNVFVAGRFYGAGTQFDSFILTGFGDGDAYVVEYDPDGNVLRAKNFGGTEFDSPQELTVDLDGNVIVAGYFYSYSFRIDSFTKAKTEFQADVFVITMDDHLNALCVKQVSGEAENLAYDLDVDNANNIWLVIGNIFGFGTTRFDNVYSVPGTMSSMIVAIGANPIVVPGPAAGGPWTLELGPAITKCPQDAVLLNAGSWCGAFYTWSNGLHGSSLITRLAGLYWVEVELNGTTKRDSIVISDLPKIHVSLGDDQEVCQSTPIHLVFDTSQPNALGASYFWDNGSILSTRSILAPGLFWVKVVDRCETVFDSLTVEVKLPVPFDLGKDSTVCAGQPVEIGAEVSGAVSYLWQDGTTSPQQSVTTSGTYELTVFDGCEEERDSITITFINRNDLLIPSVVTANDDGKNDAFLIPDELTETGLKIFNRWGELVYSTATYHNEWSGATSAAGVYYYLLEGKCLEGYKGYVHLIK